MKEPIPPRASSTPPTQHAAIEVAAKAGSKKGSKASFVRGVTLLGAVALIVGNMVGTSIYTLPATLAGMVGPLGMVAWAITAFGYLFVALVYARLGTRWPKTGGPYVFAREAFGDFAGFQTVWAYWFSATVGNAGIAAGVVGYAVGFSKPLADSTWLQFGLAQALLWGLTLVNVLGVKQSSRLQITILFLNIVPLLGITIVALFFVDTANLTPFAPQGWGALPAAVAYIVWAYSGIESATVPAEEVAAPETTISRATMIGYALGTLVFLLSAFAVAGVLPNGAIAGSARPIALVAEKVFGSWGGTLIGVAAIVAGLGTLNGWILMAGRIPVTAAQDGIFFERFARIHPRFRTPHLSLILGSVVASGMLFMMLRASVLATFSFIVGLSVLTTLLPHLFAAAADLMLVRRDPERYTPAERRKAHITAPIAFVFVMFTIYGVGPETCMWGFLVVLAGTPLYVWFKTREARTAAGA
jgi:basic amino acid/polyamine antiporter, APA family